MRYFLLCALLLGSPVAALAEVHVLVSNAYAPAMLGSPVGAGFMDITNHHHADCTLASASSPISRVTEIHDHVTENGVMKMRKINGVTIPTGQSVLFKSGGLHLMFIDLEKPLVAGESFPVLLDFGDCGKLEQTFTIKPQS